MSGMAAPRSLDEDIPPTPQVEPRANQQPQDVCVACSSCCFSNVLSICIRSMLQQQLHDCCLAMTSCHPEMHSEQVLVLLCTESE